MVTLWLIEALSRAGEFDSKLLAQSVSMLEDFIGEYFLVAGEQLLTLAPQATATTSVCCRKKSQREANRLATFLRYVIEQQVEKDADSSTQAFSHVSLISTCFNLDRAIKRWRSA